MGFLVALQFLTSIPLPWKRETSLEDVGRSTGFFPLVGLVIGLILFALDWLLSLILPSAIVNALLLVSLAIITGGLHLDGFADTCDGLGGHRSVEDRLRIMHDSRKGSFGVVGIVLLLLVKYVSLDGILDPLKMVALVFMPVVSRWAMVYALFAYPYARPAGLGKAVKEKTSGIRFAGATLITLAIAIALIPIFSWGGLITMFAVWVIIVAVAAYIKSKLSGLTGDSYGAINEVAEVSALIIVVILAHLGLA